MLRTRVGARRAEEILLEGARDRMVLLGERHLRRAVAEYVEHYHRERSHQGLGNRLIGGEPQSGLGPITCHPRLGGLLNHYARRAA